MNIVFFGTRMDLISGHSRPAYELAAHMIRRGHSVRIVSSTLNSKRQKRHEIIKRGDPSLKLIPEERPFDSLQELVIDQKKVRQRLENILRWSDLVHGFSFNALTLLTYLFPKEWPIILTSNTDFNMPWSDIARLRFDVILNLVKPGNLYNLVAPDFLFRTMLARMDHIVTFTTYLQSRLLALNVPVDKVTNMHPGLDLSRFVGAARQTIAGRPVFLYYGLLSSLRGVRTLVSAFARVRRVEPGAVLILADRGRHTTKDRRLHRWERERLLRLAKKHAVLDAVLWPDFRLDIATYINAADAVVLPFESSFGYSQPPLTILESMALGKLIISTPIGSIPQFIRDGETGVLVQPGDSSALAQAMLRWNESGCRALGEAAREEIELQFNWEDTVEKLLLLYDEVR